MTKILKIGNFYLLQVQGMAKIRILAKNLNTAKILTLPNFKIPRLGIVKTVKMGHKFQCS